MAVKSLLVLTSDEQVLRSIVAAACGVRVEAISCLSEVDALERKTRLILDWRSLHRCCLKTLATWRLRVGPHQIAILRTSLAAGQGPINLPADFCAEDARRAWETRSNILSLPGLTALARRFLALARAHDHEAYTAREAAAVLGVGVRRLTRHTMRSYSFPPRVVLDLCRIVSVARTLRSHEATLDTIAATHGYANISNLSRHFLRFVGERPGAYRGGDLARRPSRAEKSSVQRGH